jgi:glucose 1-dehydrogenase
MKISSTLLPGLAAISGGLGDIGKAIALRLAGAGADIAVGDLAPTDAAEPLRAEIEKLGRRFFCRPLDVSDSTATEIWYREASEDMGRPPNLIIPNAAISTSERLGKLSPETWRREIDVNLNGAFYFSHFGAQGIIAQGLPGRIVVIGSWAAHAPHREIPAYCVSKAALRMLCKMLALELAEKSILVNEVAPGYVDAGLSARIFRDIPGLRDKLCRQVPVRKLIEASEVAEQVIYFLSDAGTHLTGSTCLMDGGLSLIQGPMHEA